MGLALAGLNQNLKRLLLVCFLDMMSYAMFSPLIAFLFIKGPYSVLGEEDPSRYFLLGLFLSSYSLVQVISVPLWGRLAAVLTKKLVLRISFLGNAIGYGFCALGCANFNVWYLFAGAVVSGITGANMAMINAMVSYETKQHHWARFYSLFGATIGLAFIVGPQFTALVMDFFPTQNFCFIVMLICVGISLFNFMFVETLRIESDFEFNPHLPWKPSEGEEASAFHSGHMKRIFVFLFCVYFAWFFFIKFFQVYLFEAVQLTEKECCYVTSYLGFCCTLWQGARFLLGLRLLQRRVVLQLATMVMCLSMLGFFWVNSLWQALLITLLLSMAYSIIIPSILALILLKGSSTKEYKTSLYQAVQSAAKILAPLLSGALSSFSKVSAAYLSAGLLAFAVVLIVSKPESFRFVTRK